jgi:hypothetical protein
MSLSSAPLIPADGVLVLSDASGTPKTVTITYTDGDLKIDGLAADAADITVFEKRNVPYAARQTGRKRIKVTFSCHILDLSNGSAGTPLDAVRKTGVFAAGVSTWTAGDVWFVDLLWTGERTSFGASADASIRLKKFHPEASFSEGIPGKFEITGEAIIVDTDTSTGDLVIA